jgi:hypothetical protein
MAHPGYACKACAKTYHWCCSCGDPTADPDFHALAAGYCSPACLEAGGGPPFVPESADEEGT